MFGTKILAPLWLLVPWHTTQRLSALDVKIYWESSQKPRLGLSLESWDFFLSSGTPGPGYFFHRQIFHRSIYKMWVCQFLKQMSKHITMKKKAVILSRRRWCFSYFYVETAIFEKCAWSFWSAIYCVCCVSRRLISQLSLNLFDVVYNITSWSLNSLSAFIHRSSDKSTYNVRDR